MLGLRLATALALLTAGIAPAVARGPSCGASCATWVFPLAATAAATCLVLAGGHFLAMAFVPRLRLWADARRGRVRNTIIGIAFALAGVAILVIIVQTYARL